MHLKGVDQDFLFEGGSNFIPEATVESLTIPKFNLMDEQLSELGSSVHDLSGGSSSFDHFELLRMAGINITGNMSEIEELMNLSMKLDISVMHRFQNNIRVSYVSLACLVLTYTVFMILGGVGNCLVVAAVIRNSSLRTARNLFPLNLALSDLLLCVLTMPLTLLEIVTQHWPLSASACKAAGTLQATAVFASTLSIVAIALDRYMVSLIN